MLTSHVSTTSQDVKQNSNTSCLLARVRESNRGIETATEIIAAKKAAAKSGQAVTIRREDIAPYVSEEKWPRVEGILKIHHVELVG